MYDDEFDEYDDDEQDTLSLMRDAREEAFRQKGAEDRKFVDEQREQYDARKKAKRDELYALKLKQRSLQSTMLAKERELKALSFDHAHEAYLEMRERVVAAREETSQSTRERESEEEMREQDLMRSAQQAEEKKKELEAHVRALKGEADELARTISMLEHELMRT